MLLLMLKHLRVPVCPVVIVRGDRKSKWITAVWNNCPSDCCADSHTFCNMSARKLMTFCGLCWSTHTHTHMHKPTPPPTHTCTCTHTCCNTSARKMVTCFELKEILKSAHNRSKLLWHADVFKTSSQQCHLNTFVWILNCIFHLYTQPKTFLKEENTSYVKISIHDTHCTSVPIYKFQFMWFRCSVFLFTVTTCMEQPFWKSWWSVG